MSGPSVGGGFSGPRKHGFGRFSLGRLFNIATFSHRSSGGGASGGNSASTQHCSGGLDVDKRSESSIGVTINSKAHTHVREPVRFATATAPGPSSSNSESTSFCSGQIDMRDMPQEMTKDLIECPLCLFELPSLCFPNLSSCTHQACYNCLQQYLKIEISESRVNISCPECTEPIHPSDIRMILNDEVVLAKYESFMLRRVLVTEPDARWCPAPDCGYAVIAHGCAGCPKLKCERPGCNTFFCYHCKQEWHPNQTCDAARAQRARHSTHPRSSSVSFSQDSMIQTGDDIKPCPCCKVLIIKMDDGSCNHMTCSVCGTEFCWLCMKEISDLHYLSPSGCTFWGKKPWSRKKKIMWQLGMLVGAPVGIALIAGIAVPAIIIGIPVWVGRKLHAKYNRPPRSTSKLRRNLIISSGVIASIIVSPILAGIAVGIGVPILLAYVYGVVPISLCRSGGCGVSTSASGVRIEFDEENEIGIGNIPASGNFDGASVDTALSQRGVNPSIGEVSLGMSTSLSLGSGSHLDRIGMTRDRESDRESASNVALAGSIASASLVAGTHKLEIQADVSSNKRFSLSSHSETASATVSLSERSANMSLADDASTKALAGSILGYRDNSAVTPVEVHVDANMSSEEIRLNESSKEFLINNAVVAEKECNECTDGSTACKIETTAFPYVANTNNSENGSHNATRFKLWKSSKKRKHNNCSSTPDDSLADSTSLKGEAYSFGGHVHFSEFREDCVSYIDESPCNDIGPGCKPLVLHPVVYDDELEDSDAINARTLTFKRLLQGRCPTSRTTCVVEIPEKCETTPETAETTKSVSRSVSFCNGCTPTHKPCCPDAYQRRSQSGGQLSRKPEELTSAVKDTQTAVAGTSNCSHFEPFALVNRAYKMPRSMQDITLELSVGEDNGRKPAFVKTAASVDCMARMGAATQQDHRLTLFTTTESRNSATDMPPKLQPYHLQNCFNHGKKSDSFSSSSSSSAMLPRSASASNKNSQVKEDKRSS